MNMTIILISSLKKKKKKELLPYRKFNISSHIRRLSLEDESQNIVTRLYELSFSFQRPCTYTQNHENRAKYRIRPYEPLPGAAPMASSKSTIFVAPNHIIIFQPSHRTTHNPPPSYTIHVFEFCSFLLSRAI